MAQIHSSNEETLLHQMVETIVREFPRRRLFSSVPAHEAMRGLIPTLIC